MWPYLQDRHHGDYSARLGTEDFDWGNWAARLFPGTLQRPCRHGPTRATGQIQPLPHRLRGRRQRRTLQIHVKQLLLLICVNKERCIVYFVFRKKRCKAIVVSPSDDTYYYWLLVIGAAVLYNWTLLVVRSEKFTVGIHNPCTYINNCDVTRYIWNNKCILEKSHI